MSGARRGGRSGAAGVPEQHDLAGVDLHDLDVVELVGRAQQRRPARRRGARSARRRGWPSRGHLEHARRSRSRTAGTSRTPAATAAALAASSRSRVPRSSAPLTTAAGCISHAAAAISTLSRSTGRARRRTPGGRRPGEGDGAADLLGVGRHQHRPLAVGRERLRPAQRLQPLRAGGALDVLAVGGDLLGAAERPGLAEPHRHPLGHLAEHVVDALGRQIGDRRRRGRIGIRPTGSAARVHRWLRRSCDVTTRGSASRRRPARPPSRPPRASGGRG